MDSITRYRIDKNLELYGDRVVKAFEDEFSMSTLKSNPETAVEMLDYLSQAFAKTLKESKAIIEQYETITGDYPKQTTNLLTFSNNFKVNRIRNIAEIYKYIWGSISSYVENDGTVTPSSQNKEDDEYI